MNAAVPISEMRVTKLELGLVKLFLLTCSYLLNKELELGEQGRLFLLTEPVKVLYLVFSLKYSLTREYGGGIWKNLRGMTTMGKWCNPVSNMSKRG